MGVDAAVSATEGVLCVVWLERVVIHNVAVVTKIISLSNDNPRGKIYGIKWSGV